MKKAITCVHCGAVLPDGAETCPVCGRSQRRLAPVDISRRLAMRLMAALSLLLLAAAVILRIIF